MRLIGTLLLRLSPLLRSQAVRLQSQMDIHPRSLWHDPTFSEGTGGFFPPLEGFDKRKISGSLPWDSVRRDMLVLLMRDIEVRRVFGSLAALEIGRGGTARLIHHYLPERPLHLFTAIAGFPNERLMPGARANGDLAESPKARQTAPDRLHDRVAPSNGNVVFHPGIFPANCTVALARERFAFVHLGADLRETTRVGLETFFPLVVPGGYIVVHAYNAWHGARKATDDFLADKAEVAVPMPDKCGSAVIIKTG